MIRRLAALTLFAAFPTLALANTAKPDAMQGHAMKGHAVKGHAMKGMPCKGTRWKAMPCKGTRWKAMPRKISTKDQRTPMPPARGVPDVRRRRNRKVAHRIGEPSRLQ